MSTSAEGDMQIGKVVRITAANAGDCERAMIALRDQLDTLALMTERYPVECTFGGYRFVFTSKADITDLIAALDTKLTRYRSAA